MEDLWISLAHAVDSENPYLTVEFIDCAPRKFLIADRIDGKKVFCARMNESQEKLYYAARSRFWCCRFQDSWVDGEEEERQVGLFIESIMTAIQHVRNQHQSENMLKGISQ